MHGLGTTLGNSHAHVSEDIHAFYEFAVQRGAEVNLHDFKKTQKLEARGIYSMKGLVAWGSENDFQES